MKVAITHTRYSRVGGVEMYIHSLVARLLDAGHEVHYFCHFWEPDADPRIQFHKISNPFKPIRFLKVWSFDRASEKQVRNADFDVVHGFTKTSWQDIYTDGSGCLLDYQEYSLQDRDAGSPLARTIRRLSLHQRMVERIERARFARGNFRRIVAMSEFARQQILRRYGLAVSDVEVIYNGIESDRFHPDNVGRERNQLRQDHGFEADAFVVLMVGNDYRRKGLRTLLEAAARIKSDGGLASKRPLRLAIVGKERRARERSYRGLARQLDVAEIARFCGPQRDIARWHAAADLFALPTRFDIFGNVVLEAMATGVPPLVSDRAGAAEVVRHDETGYVMDDPRDSASLAGWIRALDADPEKRAAFGREARRDAEGYSWDKHFKRILELYEAVRIEKNASRAASR